MISLNNIRRIIVLSLSMITGCILTTQGQEIKFEDLYNQIGKLTPQQLYYRLFQYQNQNPQFANTYVQLGNTAEMIIKDLDPLRDFEQVNYWIGNAVLYYSLFERFLDGNEVRRNREFYANIPIESAGRRIENEDVLSYVYQRSNYCINFKDSVTLIFRALEKSKDHYNNCVRIFNEINEGYDNLNEVLLQTDQTFLTLLNSLESEFSQSIESFDNYKSIISAYPIKGYNQSYHLKTIETYRLDGLTNSDFLRDTFELWDFGKWTNSFVNSYNNDILPLRNEISSIQKIFTDNRRKISLAESIGPDDVYATYDDLFLFRLGKYDNSSLVRELFRYLDGRQDYLVIGKSPLNNPSDSTSDLMNRKLRYYHRLALQNVSTNVLLHTFKDAINLERINRFKQFFDQQYGGQAGLIRFADQEDQLLHQTMDDALQNLKNYFEKEENTRRNLGSASGARGVNIPLYPVNQKSSEFKTLTHVTKSVFDIQGEPLYASGFIQRAGRSPMAFAAKIAANRKVEWMREVGAKGRDALTGGDQARHIFGFDQGCMVVVSGKASDDMYKNTLIRLDNKGKDVFSKAINITSPCVFYHFDDINQISLLGFASKGIDTLDVYNSFIISKVDSLGSVLWQTPIELNGELVDIIRVENRYLAFFNFVSFEINGEKVNAGKNNYHTGHVIVELSDNGELLQHYPTLSIDSFSIFRIFSISSDEINLLGYSNQPDQISTKLKYLIVNSKGEIIYKNFE